MAHKITNYLDDKEPTLQELHDARNRWGAISASAILKCAETEGIGIRKLIEIADTTQRYPVALVAKEYYGEQFGLTEDTLETFIQITNMGITGAGFNFEMFVGRTENGVTAEQFRCPLIDYGQQAGYEVGHPAYEEHSLWCDTYDNFESAAVAPTQAMVHTHCLGRGDKSCRLYMEAIDEEHRRQEGEHIHDYLKRMRDTWRDRKPDGPWLVDRYSKDVQEELARENWAGITESQNQIAPTLYDKKKRSIEIQGRIGASSLLIAGHLLGWDRMVSSMSEREGPALQKEASARIKSHNIKGNTASDAAELHLRLVKGMGFGEYEVTKKSENYVTGSCTSCPIVTYGKESGLNEEIKNVSKWCSAARTFEAQTINENLTHSYTRCIGKGDKECRWIIDKS